MGLFFSHWTEVLKFKWSCKKELKQMLWISNLGCGYQSQAGYFDCRAEIFMKNFKLHWTCWICLFRYKEERWVGISVTLCNTLGSLYNSLPPICKRFRLIFLCLTNCVTSCCQKFKKKSLITLELWQFFNFQCGFRSSRSAGDLFTTVFDRSVRVLTSLSLLKL